ncbi:hypothetical protein ANRL1_04040 [Anaerolineae bacterium]|nr:hypothetical protein ANRL1_04040 [Anaerolineae bacterium]
MAKTLTRKQILESAAQRVGNAAAHRIVYDDPPGIREATEYEHQAKRVIEQKGWNDMEIARFREIAIRRAKKELGKRVQVEHGLTLEAALNEAIEKIDAFIAKDLQK